MCRTTEYYHHSNINDERFIRLKSVSVSLSSTTEENNGSFLPKSLTLVFLPRINGSFLEINASKYRPDSTAFVTLHRSLQSDSVFTSYDEIRARDGVVFEVHMGENRLLHGVLRRRDDGVLAMEVKSVLRKDCGVRDAEICFTSENGVVLNEKMAVVVKRNKKRSKFCRRRFEVALDEIPEERESDVTEEEESGGVCCCSCGEDEDQMVEMELEMEKEIEGVKWAVDVGIWAVCLGVGFFVTRASARNLRRRRKFLL